MTYKDKDGGDPLLDSAVDVGLAGPYLMVPVDRDMFVRMLEDLTLSGMLQKRVMDNLWQVTLTREPGFTASEEAFNEAMACARSAGKALDDMYIKVGELRERHAESPLFGLRVLAEKKNEESEKDE